MKKAMKPVGTRIGARKKVPLDENARQVLRGIAKHVRESPGYGKSPATIRLTRLQEGLIAAARAGEVAHPGLKVFVSGLPGVLAEMGLGRKQAEEIVRRQAMLSLKRKRSFKGETRDLEKRAALKKDLNKLVGEQMHKFDYARRHLKK